MRLTIFKDTNAEMPGSTCISVILLIGALLLPTKGYIINEDGQLVPFKIFKKGMCFLHPRNCRGGFHKRKTGEKPQSDRMLSDDLLQVEVYKRKYTHKDSPSHPPGSYFSDDPDDYPMAAEDYPTAADWQSETFDNYPLYSNNETPDLYTLIKKRR